jgi:hypothetical protein
MGELSCGSILIDQSKTHKKSQRKAGYSIIMAFAY